MFRHVASNVSRRILHSGVTKEVRILCTSKVPECGVSSTTNATEDAAVVTTPLAAKGGFAKAFEKFTNIQEEKDTDTNQTFATMLRNSKLMDLGDPEGKIVIGKIYHVVGDDLYIDFGWKFHCVCTRPSRNREDYVRGARVRLEVRELELSSRFLGSDTDLTLLEADCRMIGLVSSPARPVVAENA